MSNKPIWKPYKNYPELNRETLYVIRNNGNEFIRKLDNTLYVDIVNFKSTTVDFMPSRTKKLLEMAEGRYWELDQYLNDNKKSLLLEQFTDISIGAWTMFLRDFKFGYTYHTYLFVYYSTLILQTKALKEHFKLRWEMD